MAKDKFWDSKKSGIVNAGPVVEKRSEVVAETAKVITERKAVDDAFDPPSYVDECQEEIETIVEQAKINYAPETQVYIASEAVNDKYSNMMVNLKDPTLHNKLEVFLLDPRATVPTRNNPNDAGLDLYALEDNMVEAGKTRLIETGVAVRIPEGYVGLLRERSSIGKKGLKVCGGVIDAGYAGDISIVLLNPSNKDHTSGYLVQKGDRVAQLVIVPALTPEVKVVSEIWTSARSNKGFGSSGK